MLFLPLSILWNEMCFKCNSNYPPASEASREVANFIERKNPHTPVRRTSFLTTFYGLYFSHHCTHVAHMLDLCGQLSCTASTPVFLTYQYSSYFLGFHSEPLPLQIATLTILISAQKPPPTTSIFQG